MTSTQVRPSVQLRGVRRSFGERVVLDGIDLSIAPGEFVALLGQSGTGKSTLLRALAGLDSDIEGHIMVPRQRAVVFQEPRLMPWKRVWRNVVLGLDEDGKGKPDRARASLALAEVGLTTHEDAWPATLSGGEAQRVALARALARRPELLLLDEPFANLDVDSTRLMVELLLDFRTWPVAGPVFGSEVDPAAGPSTEPSRGRTIILTTHQAKLAEPLADRTLTMRSGAILSPAKPAAMAVQ